MKTGGENNKRPLFKGRLIILGKSANTHSKVVANSSKN